MSCEKAVVVVVEEFRKCGTIFKCIVNLYQLLVRQTRENESMFAQSLSLGR